MNFSRFFIDKPIFAAVLSIIIFVAGLLSIFKLPISEYPDVVPPTVVVRAQYPGANPKIIAETVAAPLEEQINGVENMLYMSSQATSDGALQLTVTFKIGTNVEQAETAVQSRVQRALPRLPEETRQIGVITVKSSPNLAMVVHLVSPDNRYDDLYLRNYAVLNVKDQLARIPGMGEVNLFGSGDYAMRVWLDPQKVAARGLIAPIREQNVQVAAGVIGAAPAKDAQFQLTLNTKGRLQTVEQFGDIIVRTGLDGATTHLRDVARLELGSNAYSLRSLLNNKSAVGMGIFQAPNANALPLSTDVHARMDELKKVFPQGVHRHRAGAVRSIYTDRFRVRPVGPVLPPVRADDRHLDRDFGLLFADAGTGPGRGAPRPGTKAASRRCCAVKAPRSDCTCCWWWLPPSCSSRCRPASCQVRTSNTWSVLRSCRTPPRSTAPTP